MVTSFITSRPVCVYSCSQLRELWFNDLFMYMYVLSKLPALWVLVLWLTLSTVSAIFTGTENTGAPVAYDDIEPDTTNCEVNSAGSHVLCSVGSVLSDGDIGPTHSVDVSDPDQVHRFFVWNRVNGTVALQFQRNNAFSRFNVSYIDIYTLSAPSARIGSPGTTSFTTLEGGTVSSLNTQSCSFSSSASTLSRTTFNMSLTNIKALAIRFEFTSQDIDWLFISEIQLCEGNAPSSISCDPPPTDTPTQTPTPPPSPTPPPMTLTPLPSPVTPDLHQPDSVSLTCSVASPATDDYQYQWQWWKNRTLLNTQFTITNTTNTQSSSLHISGLGYSDAGEYMCGVQYAMCPDGVDCSGATPVTGNIQLNLPGTLIHVVHISTQPPSLSPWSVHCNSVSLEVKGHTVCSRGD